MSKGEGKDKKVVGADWVPPDEARTQLDASEEGNPRLKINVPANKLFIEVTDSVPGFMVVVCRVDNPIMAKGALAQAHDMILLMEHKANQKAALSLGVAEATGKPLTKEAIAKKLAEGVH